MDKTLPGKKKIIRKNTKKSTVESKNSRDSDFLLPYDILLHLFQFITLKSLLALSSTCTYYRPKLQSEDYCFRLVNLYGNISKEVFIKKRTKFPSNIHTLYYLLLPHLTSYQFDDTKLFDQYKICKKIGKYGNEDKVRDSFRYYGIAVCYGIWKKNRTSLIAELNLLPSEDKYYFPILDALIKSNNEEKIQEILDARPYLRSPESLVPLFTCIKCKNETLFKLILDKISILDRNIVSVEFSCLVSLAFKNELFLILGFLVQGNYGTLELYEFLAQGNVKTRAQLDYIISSANSLAQVLCIAVKPKILTDELLDYLLDVIDDKFDEFPTTEIINYCFNYNLAYSLEWMIKTKRIKIMDIKCNSALLASKPCLKVVAKYKHPYILKNVPVILERYTYTFCKELLLNYIIGENGKIDKKKKEKYRKKYSTEIFQKLLDEY